MNRDCVQAWAPLRLALSHSVRRLAFSCDLGTQYIHMLGERKKKCNNTTGILN